jgi:2-keto-3-deoxy-L-fuconate dehydrogenase
MTVIALTGKRVLLTQADAFMGPALRDTFAEAGAEVIADTRVLTEPDAAEALVQDSGRIDVLLANLALPAPATAAIAVDELEWENVFARLVHPLFRLCRAVLAQMTERRSGKVLLIGSASALRGLPRASSYSAARGAQLAYIQALGVEMAPHNVQVNAIAQNFVENPTDFPPSLQSNPAFQERLRREVPLGRLVSAREDAQFAAYLCSEAANCFVGQVFPVAGGWVAR